MIAEPLKAKPPLSPRREVLCNPIKQEELKHDEEDAEKKRRPHVESGWKRYNRVTQIGDEKTGTCYCAGPEEIRRQGFLILYEEPIDPLPQRRIGLDDQILHRLPKAKPTLELRYVGLTGLAGRTASPRTKPMLGGSVAV